MRMREAGKEEIKSKMERAGATTREVWAVTHFQRLCNPFLGPDPQVGKHCLKRALSIQSILRHKQARHLSNVLIY